MKPISEKVVEKTWQEMGDFNPVRANKEMMEIGSSQPELLAFLTESTEEMDQEVKELGIYMFFVIYRMFQKTHGKIKKISSEEIINCHDHNVSLLESLEGTHEKFLDRVASIQISRQPYVMEYVVEALMEEDVGEEAVALTDEQKGVLFVLLKTVIDALDQKSMKL